MRTSPLILVALAGTLALCPSALAQNTSRPGTPPAGVGSVNPVSGSGTASTWAHQVINIKFPGGNVRQYVDLVRAAAAPSVINVVYTNQIAECLLPPVELTGITVASAFEVIGQLENPEGGNSARATLVAGQRSAAEAPVFRIEQWGGGGRPAPDAYRVVSLSEITSSKNRVEGSVALTSTAALRAIETAVEVATGPEDPTPVLKFHEDTGTLVIAGNKQQCLIAEEVVGNLKRDASRSQEVDRSKRRIVEQVRVRNVQAVSVSTQLGAIFSALSGRPDSPGSPLASITADLATNSVTIIGPQDYTLLARAMVTLIDDEKVSDAARTLDDRLRTMTAEMNAERRAAQMQRAELEQQVASSRKSLDELSKEAMTARVEAESIRASTAVNVRQAEELRAEVARLRDTLLTTERQSAQQRVQLAAELLAAQEQKARLEATVSELQNQLKPKK
ncbi:MAG: hypothetical protein ACT4PL_10385 [Phycisphaerales bacterium]